MLHMLQVGWSQWANPVDIHNILLGKHHVLYTLPVDVRLREILRGLCVCMCVCLREAQRDVSEVFRSWKCMLLGGKCVLFREVVSLVQGCSGLHRGSTV